MNMKLVLTNTVLVCVLGFSGVIAFKSDMLFGTVVDQVCIADSDEAMTRMQNPLVEALVNPRALPPLPPDQVDRETLWLARAIYSETKRPGEQILVAWVIRNRVETRYRGKSSYEEVILDPFQFSAFHPEGEKRDHYAELDATSREPGWRTALSIAYAVRHMDPIYRPFSPDTRHFYSEQSMTTGSHPAWASDLVPVKIQDALLKVDDRRFRFFRGVS